MAKVLRLTRHPMSPEQKADLERIYGVDVTIVEVAAVLSEDEAKTLTAAKVKELVETMKPDAVEATLPMPMIAELTGPRGLRVPLIKAITEREEREGEATVFKFKHYEQVERVEIVTKIL